MIPLPYFFWSNWADVAILNIIGVIVCLYSLHIELRKEKDPSFKAACDFNEHMSCSRVLTSKYSHGFGLAEPIFGRDHILNSRNCNMGLVMYLCNLILCFVVWEPLASTIMLFCAASSIFVCVYLAAILAFVLRDLCVVCITTYVINGCILYLAYQRYTYFNLLSH
ncbi:vitamin K epoxide reductase complex subunit 1-like [Plakobranchus ocellatus]|uniref:vitamin-K-epoxide reductase (warfarin-sensitive) n=1 Tax=Plakobranchus ocellatus TaxID=259542 RepID=A0AAV4DB90_9GAST|nr:vitamin K epoxide reductase complex subunit 1-like [Plakobranchus ocellatus]